jgi:flagellar hook assembly protein FlgD
MKKVSLILVVISAVMIPGSASAAQSMKQLMTRPLDTLEAERVRIWIPVERRNACQLTVNISDSSGDVIRHLVDQLVGYGYYNFYWDKKNDNGEFVEPGEYAYASENCGKKRSGVVRAEFKKWERLCRILPMDSSDSASIRFELLADSANVSIKVYNARELLVDSAFTDSLMNRGLHMFSWRATNMMGLGGRTVQAVGGKYLVHLSIGDYTRQETIWRRR